MTHITPCTQAQPSPPTAEDTKSVPSHSVLVSTRQWREGQKTARGPLSTDIKSADVAKHINLWRKPG